MLGRLWPGTSDGGLLRPLRHRRSRGCKSRRNRTISAQIPNGSPSTGDRLHMVWTEGVCTGKLSRQKFVDVIATHVVNGIYPRKGTLAVGSDADIVIFDPSYEA